MEGADFAQAFLASEVDIYLTHNVCVTSQAEFIEVMLCLPQCGALLITAAKLQQQSLDATSALIRSA